MKFMQWLLKVTLTITLVCGLTVFTTGMVVNAYLESILAKFNIQFEGETFTWGGMVQGMFGTKSNTNTSMDTNIVKNPDPDTHTNVEVEESSTVNKDDKTEGTKSEGDSEEAGEEAPIDALPVMGQNQSEESDVEEPNNRSESGKDQLVIVTPDEVLRKKDNLPVGEKEEIFNILMTKLPQQEVQNISTAMENGLTEQELISIEKTLSQYLSQEEYDKLMALLKA
ncbi:hypothetical protein J2T13_003827 [Paenibacillus sp. DS2015]|uniref:hypothetical protein n=1 Tax=Paenibacillus sp. DS2015 TaxID=3373917 RepID=UPI003D209C5B